MRSALLLAAISLCLTTLVHVGSAHSAPRAEVAGDVRPEMVFPIRFGVDTALPSPAPKPSLDPLKIELDALQVANEDLVQQKAMAEHSRKSVWIGVANLLISVTALILLGWTMLETRRATKAAREAADAAHKSVAMQYELGRKQLQAYLSIDTISCQKKYADLVMKVYCRNSGQSPATKTWVVAVGIIELVDIKGERIPGFGPAPLEHVQAIRDIPSQSERSFELVVRLPESMDIHTGSSFQSFRFMLTVGIFAQSVFDTEVSDIFGVEMKLPCSTIDNAELTTVSLNSFAHRAHLNRRRLEAALANSQAYRSSTNSRSA